MKILGSRPTYIGSLKLDNSKCKFCEVQNAQSIVEYGKCFHVFMIPIFPLGRETFLECGHCERTLKKSEFDYKLKKFYYKNSSKLRRPWWHWTGTILMLLHLGFLIIMNLPPNWGELLL